MDCALNKTYNCESRRTVTRPRTSTATMNAEMKTIVKTNSKAESEKYHDRSLSVVGIQCSYCALWWSPWSPSLSWCPSSSSPCRRCCSFIIDSEVCLTRHVKSWCWRLMVKRYGTAHQEDDFAALRPFSANNQRETVCSHS